jgi:hypothetical protein
MMRLTIILVMLTSVLCSLRAQQPAGALIGITDLAQSERHLYAVDFPIVESEIELSLADIHFQTDKVGLLQSYLHRRGLLSMLR